MFWVHALVNGAPSHTLYVLVQPVAPYDSWYVPAGQSVRVGFTTRMSSVSRHPRQRAGKRRSLLRHASGDVDPVAGL